MISIREFTRQVTAMRDQKKLLDPIDWNSILADRGYVPVPIGYRVRRQGDRTARLAWCVEQFGEEHYAWTGSNFWFETESDAVLFALRWGQDG